MSRQKNCVDLSFEVREFRWASALITSAGVIAHREDRKSRLMEPRHPCLRRMKHAPVTHIANRMAGKHEEPESQTRGAVGVPAPERLY